MQLAQINIARMLAPLDSPIMADFVANLDRINSLADQSEGFVWRYDDMGDENATLNVFQDDFLIINMSVWKSIDNLFAFVYRSKHLEIFKRKREWFENMTDQHLAFWHIDDGHQPTLQEAKERLEYLRKHGESDFAFTFKKMR